MIQILSLNISDKTLKVTIKFLFKKNINITAYFYEVISVFSCSIISSCGYLIFNTFAGTPPMIEYGGHDFVTTAPAATTEPRPIVTSFSIVTLDPSKHRLL